MTLSSLVCRTCLGIISESKKGYSIEDENGLIQNVRNIREMIIFCFPEMDTYISVKPSICDTCLGLLINLYNFKIRCMKVENVIRAYIQNNNLMEGSCVNLHNVVRLQILEALKQKNWPLELIKEYMFKVDACLEKSRVPVPPIPLTCSSNSTTNNETANSVETPVSSHLPSSDVFIDITDSGDEIAELTRVLNKPVSDQSVSQENYLSTLNLINCNTLREEVSLVQSAREIYNSSPRTRHFVKSVGSQLRQIRKPMPKCRREEINANTQNSEEVLIMNFVENEDLLSNVDSNLKEAYISRALDRPSLKVYNKKPREEIKKRKLTPEETVQEILSKRRKLVVKINPSFRYLHKNKSLVVVVEKSRCYPCAFCKFSCLSSSALQLHHDRIHKTCKLCNYKCSTKPVLDKHLNQEHADDVKSIIKLYNEDKANFLCYCCNYVGLSKSDLRDHRFRSHIKFDGTGLYKCPIPNCDVENCNSYPVVVHMETKHDSVKKRECPLCNHNTAGSPYDAKQHVLTHSFLRAVCTFCGMCYRTNGLLKNHMEKEHAVPIRQQQAGMVYDFTADHRNLTTNKDGMVTLGEATAQPEVICDDRAGSGIYSWRQPSLVEMLCSSSLHVTPEQQGDCVIVDENSTDQDCVIVENNSMNDISFHDWILHKLAPNESARQSTEVITIDDEDDDHILFEKVGCNKSSNTSDSLAKVEQISKTSEEESNNITESRRLPLIQNTCLGKDLEESSNVTTEMQQNVAEASKALEWQTENNQSNRAEELSESTAELREVTSSQRSRQVQDPKGLSNETSKDDQSEQQNAENAAEFREVTSSQEPVQNPKESSDFDAKIQGNIEGPPEALEEQPSSEDKDDERCSSEIVTKPSEVIYSREPLKVQNAKESSNLDPEIQRNIEEPPERSNDQIPSEDNDHDRLQEFEEASETSVVTSSLKPIEIEESTNFSEGLQKDAESRGKTVAESRQVTSTRQPLHVVKESSKLDEETPSENKDEDHSRKVEDPSETTIVTSSLKRLEIEELNKSPNSAEDIQETVDVQREFGPTLEEPITATQELPPSSECQTGKLSEIASSLLHQDEILPEVSPPVANRENSCEVSSSNLLDESLQVEGTDTSLIGGNEVTSSANLN